MKRLERIFVGLALLALTLAIPGFLFAGARPQDQEPGPSGQEVEKPAQQEEKGDAVVEPGSGKRDPFAPLVRKGSNKNDLPKINIPGPGGLVTSTMRVDGVVRTSNGMIAIVSNPERRTYFIREGDQIYNGRIERITLEGLIIQETGKDPFGRPVSRQIFKRIYPSAGD